MEAVARKAEPTWKPDLEFLPDKHWAFGLRNYGMTQWRDLFTPRQLVALTTFSDLVTEAREKIRQDALPQVCDDDTRGLEDGGVTGATAYAEAVSVYLAFAVSKLRHYNNSLAVMDHPEART